MFACLTIIDLASILRFRLVQIKNEFDTVTTNIYLKENKEFLELNIDKIGRIL